MSRALKSISLTDHKPRGVKVTDGGESSESSGPAAAAAAGAGFSLEGSVINSLSKDKRNVSFQPLGSSWERSEALWLQLLKQIRESRFNPDNLDTTGLCYQT